MAGKRPIRVHKTTLTQEQMRWGEAMLNVYQSHKSDIPFEEWLKRIVTRPRDTPEGMMMNITEEIFFHRLRLERLELQMLNLIDQVAPTITLAEVHELMPDLPPASVEEWLAGNGLQPDSRGLYRRAKVLKKFGNPPIGSV